MLFRYRSCNELSLQALWDDKIWLSKGNVMNDDYDALLYFDKAKITAHVLQAINEFSRLASGKVSWEELPQIVQHFFPREVLCQMMEAIAHITVGDMESYLRHFEAFSRNAIKAYSPKISVVDCKMKLQSLREGFGEKFSQVFKTITVDNGSEFSAFSQVENWGCAVYFAHPYTSWERPQNERHNGLFRAFVPKGVSIEAFSAEYILAAADELNGRPRKKLGYRTPEELFDEFLDSVYAAEGCGSIAQDGSQRLPS